MRRESKKGGKDEEVFDKSGSRKEECINRQMEGKGKRKERKKSGKDKDCLLRMVYKKVSKEMTIEMEWK